MQGQNFGQKLRYDFHSSGIKKIKRVSDANVPNLDEFDV